MDNAPDSNSPVQRVLTVTLGPIAAGSPDGGDDDPSRPGSGPVGFFVEDDGRGIPLAERDRVLESGYATGSSPGSGLGLGIVSEIAMAHDWDVTVTDGSAGGARLEFTNVEIVSE